MRASHRWLTEFLPHLDATPEAVAERLTLAGLEVEGLEHVGEELAHLRVAEVLEVSAHPKRDRLQVVRVTLGSGEPLGIVCGAPNVPPPGGLVALAPLGAHLPALGVTLEPREIAGVPSQGMLCSEAELGLAESSAGVLVLDGGPAAGRPEARRYRVGMPLSEALPTVPDTLYTIGVTPNRPDALGHLGLARELAALFELDTLVVPGPPAAEPATISIEELIAVGNDEPERCPHYGAAAVLDATIAPSPDWLRWRLHALGIRPISNVVDVTNLLLLERGQPLHAFDLDLVRGQRIVVRRARAGEPFTTLDGQRRTLVDDDLVICDAEGPSALAGVMGGEISEIRPTTRRVLVECAYFQPRGVRRTARRHGLQTESSFRFERGVDWQAVPAVLERATALIAELSGGRVARGAVHARGTAPSCPTIRLRPRRLSSLLGVEIPFTEASAVLRRLGFASATPATPAAEPGPAEAETDDASLEVQAASWRPDVSREVDLIEEVARVRGLDRIPSVLPAIAPQPPTTAGQLERAATRAALELGLSEAITYSFVSPAELAALHATPAAVELAHPLSAERSVMRTTLLPGLLEVLRRARRHGERNARLFSVGSVFLPLSQAPRGEAAALARPRSDAERLMLPEERPCFAAVLAGHRPRYLAPAEELDVYDAKGVAVGLIERMLRRTPILEPAGGDARARHLHPKSAALISVEGRVAGVLGALHPEVVDQLDLDGSALVVELDLAVLEALPARQPRYEPIPRLPGVSRDLAVLVPTDGTAESIRARLAEAAGQLCESVELFDAFSGEGIPAGQRSLGFRMIYRDPLAARDPERARTLTDLEVDQCHERARQAAQALGQLRT